ncbi:MAG: M56 family metallopeptidase [Prosthecobacter sp.]|uniref:M56 family metallopeptidase n=1 Tax=Prosthecobacter sp. TaxID=1965333 RepID=UPI0025D6693C|nr:M56 family metallopeptidase [Prosthecobacter sp.]MCF7787208.1 M56 family metallopeptidase [Prosthecobacter sp.]
MNDFMEDLLRFLTRNPNLGLLVSALLTSSAVVCVAWAMALQLQRRSARARSLVWRITMAMLLVVAVWRLMPQAAPPVAVMEWRVTMRAPQINVAPIAVPERPVLILPEKSWSQLGLMWLESWGLRLWLGVAGALLLWKLARAFAGLVWLRKHSEPTPRRIDQQAEGVGAPSTMRCRLAQQLHSPMLTGWRRPVIWLPVEAADWDEKRLDAVLHHELAHYHRLDVCWKWLAQCAVCLWWWQPLAWLAQRCLRFETEQAADDVAVLASGDTREYARTLVEIAAGIPGRLRPTAGVTMFGGESIQQRVRELMKTNQWRGRIGIGAMSLIAVVAVVLAVLAATKVEFKPKPPLYQSEAKLVAAGPKDAGVNGQIRRMDVYAAIIETLESAEMKRRALERVRALYPDQEEKDVEIHAAQIKDSTSFRVQALSESGKYARVFLDALVDEFIAHRQVLREKAVGEKVQKSGQESMQMQSLTKESMDFVAIQERAKPATEVVQSGLIPVWRLWKSEPKPAVEETPVKPVTTQKKEPVKATN